MLFADFDSIERMLWSVRNGRCRTDVSFDTGRLLGYLACLFCHGHIDSFALERLDALLFNAQDHAMAVIYDLEAQGWA
ncbi:hypothetical protein [Pseudomonas sp. NBRC 100443]|uniref:hypothetical protein n=1 Tax=Pseudomonas sp. NBRC 100443 TaxID=1113665 RepID=UPI0024A28BC4|nr:hypothetical protein [Pseudomonas sp. NBRC 100443]GLU36576.1 hypothetical protein Pssp01_06690 [Pseudomonas sp. NBRC 100443]GLU36585.1 hypothetical protein Pssp01_06780 [Pseudomonas sp. NBRC 100443]